MYTSLNIVHNTPLTKEKSSKNIPPVITSMQQLILLVNKPLIARAASYQVKIDISGIPWHLNAQLERKTNEYLKSCGCKEGMLTGIILLVLGWFFRLKGGWVLDNTFFDMAIVFLFGAVSGKIGTYAVLRIKMSILLKRVENLIINQSKFNN